MPLSTVTDFSRNEQLELLVKLMNQLRAAGVVSRQTLRSLATDVMAVEYREDGELNCFSCLDHELHEEE